MIVLKDVWAGYKEPVIKGVSFKAERGEVVAIIGPNGAGKSTLLKTVAGLLPPKRGSVLVFGHEVGRAKKHELARLLGYVPQLVKPIPYVSVLEYVVLGRVGHKRGIRVSEEDLDAAYEALSVLGIEALARRYLDQLSGGQLQLVSLAQAIAKSPRALLLDEPTSALDVKNQYEVMETLRRLTKERGLVTLLVHHDLNLVLEYADKAILLNGGTVEACGEPLDVVRPEILKRVYGLEVKVVNLDGVWRVVPMRKASA